MYHLTFTWVKKLRVLLFLLMYPTSVQRVPLPPLPVYWGPLTKKHGPPTLPSPWFPGALYVGRPQVMGGCCCGGEGEGPADPPRRVWPVLIRAPCGPRQKSQVGITVCSFVARGASGAARGLAASAAAPVATAGLRFICFGDCFIPGDSEGSRFPAWYIALSRPVRQGLQGVHTHTHTHLIVIPFISWHAAGR